MSAPADRPLVLLGVTGGIAAYKAAIVVSHLRREGVPVQVLMTPEATRFVGPLTFEALSGRPVITDFLAAGPAAEVAHVQVARQARLFVVAPATADALARLAGGLAGDAVSLAALNVRAPCLLVPAMESRMWEHPATRANLARLREFGYRILGPAEGRLASGGEGIGRLAEPEEIGETALNLLRAPQQDLLGRRVLVTAGATREALDAVRFLSNPATGRMGYAVARAARDRGAEVELIAGPGELPVPAGVQVTRVVRAVEMHAAALRAFARCDVVVKAAAVADFQPAGTVDGKRPKDGSAWSIDLQPTPDILADMGRRKTHQILVGFAAEAGDGRARAMAKLRRKNLDLIACNDVSRAGAGFAAETNVVTVIDRDGRVEEWPCLPKREVAHRLLDRVVSLLDGPPGSR